MIDYYDLIVAATAMERGSDVATFNKTSFWFGQRFESHRAEISQISSCALKMNLFG
jgi:hypothetical protein